MDRYWIKNELSKNQTLNKTFMNLNENHFICWLYMENKKFYVTDFDTKLNAIISPKVRLKPRPLNNKQNCIKISIKKYLFSSQLKYLFVYIEALDIRSNKLIDFNEVNFCSTSIKNRPTNLDKIDLGKIQDLITTQKDDKYNNHFAETIQEKKRISINNTKEPGEIIYKKYKSPSKFWADDGFIVNEEFDTPRKPHTPIKEIIENFDLDRQKLQNVDKISSQLKEIPSFDEITQISMISHIPNVTPLMTTNHFTDPSHSGSSIYLNSNSTAIESDKITSKITLENSAIEPYCEIEKLKEISNKADQACSLKFVKNDLTDPSLELRTRSKSSIKITPINRLSATENQTPTKESCKDFNQLELENDSDYCDKNEQKKEQTNNNTNDKNLTIIDSQSYLINQKKLPLTSGKKKLMKKTNKASDDFYQIDVDINKIEHEKLSEKKTFKSMAGDTNLNLKEFSDFELCSPSKSALFISKQRFIKNEQKALSEKKQTNLKTIFSPINKKKPSNMRCLLHQLNSSLSTDSKIDNIEKNVKLAINTMEQTNRRKRLYDPCTFKIDDAFEKDNIDLNKQRLILDQHYSSKKNEISMTVNEDIVSNSNTSLSISGNKIIETNNYTSIKPEQSANQKNLEIYKESVLPNQNISENSLYNKQHETILKHKFTINPNNLQSYLFSLNNLAQN